MALKNAFFAFQENVQEYSEQIESVGVSNYYTAIKSVRWPSNTTTWLSLVETLIVTYINLSPDQI